MFTERFTEPSCQEVSVSHNYLFFLHDERFDFALCFLVTVESFRSHSIVPGGSAEGEAPEQTSSRERAHSRTITVDPGFQPQRVSAGASAIPASRESRPRRGVRVLPEFAKPLEFTRLAGDFGQTLPVRQPRKPFGASPYAPRGSEVHRVDGHRRDFAKYESLLTGVLPNSISAVRDF